MEESSFPIIIPIYYLSAGVALYTSIHSLIFAWNKDRISINIALALVSLFVAGFQISTAIFYQSLSVLEASLTLKFQMFFFFGFVMSSFAFIGIYTDYNKVIPILIPMALFFGVLLPFNYYSPHSLRFKTLEEGAPLRFPWGETVRMFSGTPSTWSWVLRSVFFGLLGFIGWRSVILYKRKIYFSAILLGISVVIFILSVLWGLLIDLGKVFSIYTGDLRLFS